MRSTEATEAATPTSARPIIPRMSSQPVLRPWRSSSSMSPSAGDSKEEAVGATGLGPDVQAVEHDSDIDGSDDEEKGMPHMADKQQHARPADSTAKQPSLVGTGDADDAGDGNASDSKVRDRGRLPDVMGTAHLHVCPVARANDVPATAGPLRAADSGKDHCPPAV